MLVGLTGGMGSGKTTVSNAFELLKVPVIDTDVIARDVLQLQPHLLKELRSVFGNDIVQSDGSLDRARLRNVAFSSVENKTTLDSIMHPAIRKQTLIDIKQHAAADYSIVVVPLLIETNFKALVDRVLVVTAPQQQKLAWLKKRSQLSTTEAMAVINAQTSDSERLSYAQDHIINDKNIDGLNKQVQALHEKYLLIAKA